MPIRFKSTSFLHLIKPIDFSVHLEQPMKPKANIQNFTRQMIRSSSSGQTSSQLKLASASQLQFNISLTGFHMHHPLPPVISLKI